MQARIRQLTNDDVNALQSLLESVPDYTQRIAGRLPAPGDAANVLAGRPETLEPADKFGFGLWRHTDLIAFADVLRGYPTGDVAYIGLLVVSPDHQRIGTGRALHAALLNRVRAWRGIRRMRLSIVGTNAAAVNPFWAALGYAPTGETKPHRRDDGVETEVVFWERLLD